MTAAGHTPALTTNTAATFATAADTAATDAMAADTAAASLAAATILVQNQQLMQQQAVAPAQQVSGLEGLWAWAGLQHGLAHIKCQTGMGLGNEGLQLLGSSWKALPSVINSVVQPTLPHHTFFCPRCGA